MRGHSEKGGTLREAGNAGSDEARRYRRYLLLLILTFLALQTVKSAFMGLHEDEANWWLQTHFLRAGYFYHPPFITYEQFLFTRLLGHSHLALRVGSLLFTAGIIYLVYLLCLEAFGDHRWAFRASLLVALLPITNYWIMLAIQDAPFIFFFLLCALLTLRIVRTGEGRYWYPLGSVAGLMLLCKLQAAFILPSIFFLLLTSREHRYWLRRKEPYLAFIIMAAIFTPTLMWYAERHFEPITYQLGNRVGFLEFSFLSYLAKALTHVVMEMIVLSPAVYALSVFGMVYAALAGYRKRGPRSAEYRVLFWLPFPTVLIFTLTGGPPNWAINGHFVALAASAGALPSLLPRLKPPFLVRHAGKLLVVLFLVLPLLFTSATLFITVGDRLQNEYRGLAVYLRQLKEERGLDEVYVASPYYFVPSEVAYYARGQFSGYTIILQVYEHVVLSAGDNSYTPWVGEEGLLGKDMFFVDCERNPDDFNTPLSYWEEKLPLYFQEVEEPLVYTYRKWSDDYRRYYIFLCRGYKGSGAAPWRRGEVRDYVKAH